MAPLITSRLLRLSLRGMLAWAILAVAGFLLARPIVTALAPYLEGVVDTMQSDYVSYLTVDDSQEGLKLVMACRASRSLTLPNGRVVPFLQSFACAKTDAVHVLVPIVIFLTIVIGWPAAGRRELARRAMGALLLLPAIIGFTTPVLLVGLVGAGLHPERFSSDVQLSALLHPFVFIEMGGGWLLPLIAAALCIRVGSLKPPSAPPSTP
jgi:hypothetical protein